MHLKFVLLFLCLIGLVPAATAKADPISVVSGFMVTGATDSYAHLSLRGGGDDRIDSQWPGLSLACQICVAGGLASPNARFLYDNVPFEWGDPFARRQRNYRRSDVPEVVLLGRPDCHRQLVRAPGDRRLR